MMGLSGIRLFLISLLLPFGQLGYQYFLPGIISVMENLDKSSYTLEVQNSKEITTDTFDFIIVGGGSAGSVLTNRLSEHFSVLLLERGGEPNSLTSIPAMCSVLTGNPDIDYNFKTVPQTGACWGSYNKMCHCNKGKGLGGSSNLNHMVYFRGHPLDFEAWTNITGDDRWKYERVLPFFLKSEDYCVSCEKYQNDPTFNPLFHNTNGPLGVTKITTQPLLEEFLQASEWDGIKRTDLNGPYAEGCAPLVFTQKYGRRSSTKVAFIDPIRSRPNLTIRKYARAYKVVFRDGSNEAYGVQYEHLGIHKIAYASKEIIISTGAIETPKLLMLSGIGPKHHLQSLLIPLRMDLPVGKNLQDHIATLIGPFLINDEKSFLPERDGKVTDVLEYLLKGTGPLTLPGATAGSMLVSSVAKNNGEKFWPDTQIVLYGIGTSAGVGAAKGAFYNVLGQSSSTMEAFLGPLIGKDSFYLTIYNGRPKSRGEITLASKDYQDDPLIDPKYYMDMQQSDIQVVLEGIKRIVHMAENAPSFRELGSKLSPVPFPLCVKNIVFRTDDYWECVVRTFSYTNYHHSGTAAMGREGSPDAVVDSELRVIGVKRLRVIDASIFPTVPSVNIQGPTIMVAERGAQFILDTYLP